MGEILILHVFLVEGHDINPLIVGVKLRKVNPNLVRNGVIIANLELMTLVSVGKVSLVQQIP